MPPPPPLKDVLEALQQSVLPGAGAAALVMCVFLVVGRWRVAALGSAVAVVVAFGCGNFALPQLTAEDPKLTWDNTHRLVLWKPTESSPCAEWLPRAALVLVVVGLLTRWLGMTFARVTPDRVWWASNLVVWWLRAWTVYLVSGWLVLGNAAADPKWELLRWELAGAMLLVWIMLDGVARSGASAEVSLYLAAMFFAGGAVLLYSRNAKFMELAVVTGSAMFGIGVAAAVLPRREDGPRALASGALPAAAAFLPGLLLGTRPSHAETPVPAVSFWLVALSALVFAPFLIPRIGRQNRWLLFVLRAALVLAPLVVAVVLAGQVAKLPYEEEPEW